MVEMHAMMDAATTHADIKPTLQIIEAGSFDTVYVVVLGTRMFDAKIVDCIERVYVGLMEEAMIVEEI